MITTIHDMSCSETLCHRAILIADVQEQGGKEPARRCFRPELPDS